MEASAVPEIRKPERRWPPAVWIGVVSAAVLAGAGGLIAAYYFAAPPTVNQPVVSSEEKQARTAGWIKARLAGAHYLNAAEHAEYPWEAVNVYAANTADGSAMWEVTGVVDAPDDLGVTTRIPWQAAIIKVGNEFKAAYVKFGDEVVWRN